MTSSNDMESPSRRCARCGQALLDGDTRCPDCGNPIEKTLLDPEAMRLEALSLQAEEDYENAETLWRRILSLNPGDAEALQAMVDLPDRIRDRDFMKACMTFSQQVSEEDHSGARETLIRMRDLAEDGDDDLIEKSIHALDRLRLRLIENESERFDRALEEEDLETGQRRVGTAAHPQCGGGRALGGITSCAVGTHRPRSPRTT